ncbi:MAG: PEP-CTERM sorting domain-containing protein [Azonexus sp.]|nr:PEP-CTERM sorting domain-containing protein [Betaproteobacteria bacterium]MBK8916536.1 PEP-CTERM sorting domain-containing protein [Betaproteobacteria bacterium]MBP6035728.1 PEP-CTERM sorting domain-containing protein [Azonexus sp.]MBP6906892.1 PEP-CTERM sorting domain-containing protein [Azonexus sp.]
MNTKFLATLLLLGITQTAQAGVINFDNLSLNDFDDIATNYGSHGAGGAGDSRVGVSYSGSNSTTTHLDFWNNNYGDLSKVAFSPSDGTLARISFTSNAGWLISSIRFDLAGWFDQDRAARTVVYNIGGNTVTLIDEPIEGDFTGNRHSSFSLSDMGSTAYIEWGNDWNIGIDNIEFTVVADPNFNGRAPEPAGLALLGSALGLLALQRRRNARRSS